MPNDATLNNARPFRRREIFAGESSSLAADAFAPRIYCPGCASMLATPLAQQCFGCGLDWHGGETRRHASSLSADTVVSRRSWLRQFTRLMIATVAAQLASLALLVLLFNQPAAFLLALLIGVPLYLWFDRRIGRTSTARELNASFGKLLALTGGILAITIPDRFLPVVIAGMIILALASWTWARRSSGIPSVPARMLLVVAATLAACHFLGIGAAVVGCFLATLSLIEFGGLMLALDAWEKRTR